MIEKVKKIFELAVEISTETDADVIVYFFGHVEKISVDYYPEGYDKSIRVIDSVDVYLDKEIETDVLGRLDEIIERLEELRSEKIGSSNCKGD